MRPANLSSLSLPNIRGIWSMQFTSRSFSVRFEWLSLAQAPKQIALLTHRFEEEANMFY